MLPVADLYLQPLGQGVDHLGANAVQAARYLVSAATELTARVQHGEDDRHRRDACLLYTSRCV